MFWSLLKVPKKTSKNTSYVLEFIGGPKENVQKYCVCFGVCWRSLRKRPKILRMFWSLLEVPKKTSKNTAYVLEFVGGP